MNGFAETETSEPTIDFKQYFFLFKAWAWLIVLAGLLAGISNYIVSVRTTPVYEASTRLLVSAPSTERGESDKPEIRLLLQQLLFKIFALLWKRGR